jgi:hypothetical protein
MNRKLLTGNGAAAWGARLAQVDYVPAFPITPQTEIIETLAHWIGSGSGAVHHDSCLDLRSGYRLYFGNRAVSTDSTAARPEPRGSGFV